VSTVGETFPDDTPEADAETLTPEVSARSRGRIFRLMNSPAGLAILGFILTSGLSAVVADVVRNADETTAAQNQKVENRAKSLSHLRALLDVTLAKRAALTDMIHYDISRDRSEADLNRIWPVYRQTVIDGTSNLWMAQRDLEEEASAISDDENDVILSNYLVAHVGYALANENECITEAHDSYLNTAMGKAERLSDARTELERCQKPDWDTLQLCMRDLTTSIDELIALRTEVLEDGAGSSPWPFGRSRFSDGSVQRERKFFEDLHARLPKNCGPEPQEGS
jgi:hypothetical protein